MSKPPSAKRRPVLALEQHAALGGDEGGDGHVGRGAEHAVVGQLEAEAEDARAEEARRQNAARPLDPGLGNAQPRHVADRHAEELEAGVLEVDAPRHVSSVTREARSAQVGVGFSAQIVQELATVR